MENITHATKIRQYSYNLIKNLIKGNDVTQWANANGYTSSYVGMQHKIFLVKNLSGDTKLFIFEPTETIDYTLMLEQEKSRSSEELLHCMGI